MALNGGVPADDDGFSKPHHLSLTIGSGDDDDDDEEYDAHVFDMRSRLQSFAMATDDGAMPPTIFLDDSDIVPTTSSAVAASFPSMAVANDADVDAEDMNHFVKNFFTNDNCLFQNTNPGDFVEEVFAEKPPKIVGDYLFGGVIGEGSYGKVKELIHVRTLMRRAVKIIKDKRIKKIPGGEQNVEREIHLLQRVRHANVVELFEIFRIEEKQKLYIIMEFCVCSLQMMLDHCVEKKLPEFQAQLYFAQLLDGLDYLHGQRIVHKDIKPGNLLLSLDGLLKICDFGVAEQLEEDEDWCTTSQGTPKFQPPEVISGTQKMFRGQLVDIWSSGVTLYNFVSGEYPFDGDVIMRLFENIITQPLGMPKNTILSAPLQELLCGVLEKDATKRWNSQKIRECEWFITKLPIENNKIVEVPRMGEMPAHRPLGVYHALEKLYEVESELSQSSNNASTANVQTLLCEIRQAGQDANLPFDANAESMHAVEAAKNGYESFADRRRKSTTNSAVIDVKNEENGNDGDGSGASKLLRIFRRKNLTNFLQRLIF